MPFVMAECDPREISFFHHDRAFRFHDPPTPLPHRWIKAYADADSARATWGCPHLPDLPGNVAARHRGMHPLFDRENRESLAGGCAQIRPWSTIALTTRT